MCVSVSVCGYVVVFISCLHTSYCLFVCSFDCEYMVFCVCIFVSTDAVLYNVHLWLG